MKNIYLDIDGTLIFDGLNNFGKPAPHLKEFLQALNESGCSVYWLSTHCTDGDVTKLQKYLQRFLPEDVRALTVGYKPTTWNNFKTEAIDFSQDFLWFDDDASLQEREVLHTHGVEDKLVEIDLQENEDQLKDIVSSGILSVSK